MKRTAETAAADKVRIALEGRLAAYTAAPVWRSALETLEHNPSRPVIVDASRLTGWARTSGGQLDAANGR